MNRYRTTQYRPSPSSSRPWKPPFSNNYRRLVTVELRSYSSGFRRSDVESLISDLTSVAVHYDSFDSGFVAARLRYRCWEDAMDAAVRLWEFRIGGAHSLLPYIVEGDYCQMEKLRDRIRSLFVEHVRGLVVGENIRSCESKLWSLEGKIEKVSYELQRPNKLGKCEELLEEKKGLESQKKVVEKRIEEFRYAMRCLLNHLEGVADGGEDEEEEKEDFQVFKFSRNSEWIRLHCLIKRECRRLDDGLPIYGYRRDILREIYNQQVMVLVGETGSGKSTQLVQFLADSGVAANDSIVCTQPRKVAAIALAHRVQEESSRCYLDEKSVVAYPTHLSGEMYSSKVIYMTDHCLLQHYMKDEYLSGISCVIVDEAHERSINTDLLLALLKNLLPQRPDLRLVIMSATADAKQLADYFFGCGTFNVEGRNFPVDIRYVPCAPKATFSSPNIGCYAYDVLEKVIEIHRTEKDGTILAFLTSQMEVEWACEKFQFSEAVALPLHGKLSHSDQLRVFLDCPTKRKVIFATNVAETSLTIPGVKYVVDSGMMKESRFEPGTGMNILNVCCISQSSAKQRAGRAGRIEAGRCYRLYSEYDFELMVSHPEPEIRRVHLGVAVLRIIALGIKDVRSFDFIDAPSEVAIDTAIKNLVQLGAVALKNGQLELTKDGLKLVRLGIEPRLGKMILHCFGCRLGKEGLVLAAVMANSSSMFCRVGKEEDKIKSDCFKVQFCHRDGDLFTLLSLYKEWEKVPWEKKNKWCWDNSINAKAMRRCQEAISEWETCLQNELNLIVPSYWRWSPESSESVRDLKLAILSSLSENIAMYSGYDHLGYEVALTGKHVQLHPSTSLLMFDQRPSWVVFGDILSSHNQYLVCVTAFDYESLSTLCPPPQFDTIKMESQRLQVRVLTGFGSMLLKKFCGKSNNSLTHLISRLRASCLDDRIGVDVDVDQNEIKLYASSQHMESVFNLVNTVLDYERKWLQNECMEKCLYVGGPGMSPSIALFGAGAEIKHLELEKRCLTVDVFLSDLNGVDDKELLPFLENYASGSICAVHKFTGYGQDSNEKKKWGRVTFLTPDAADAAVELSPFEFRESQLTIVPARCTLGADHRMFSYDVRATVFWPRRMSKGYGFVKCARQDDVAFVIDDFSNLEIAGKYVHVEPSLKDTDSIRISGLDRGLSDAEVLDVLKVSTCRNILSFKLVRGHCVNELPSDACAEALLREISPSMPKKSPHGSCVRVHVFCPNPMDYFMKATVMFDSSLHLEMAKALDQLDGKVLPGCFPWQKIQCQHLFHSSISCSPAIYSVIKAQLNSLLANFSKRKGADCYSEWSKGCFRVKISANATRTVAEMRKPLEQLMRGKTIDDCRLTPSVLQLLFSRDGMKLLKDIQWETRTHISFERHSLSVRIFGSQYKIEMAKQKLTDSLLTLYESKLLEIQLRGGDMPPDLMKKVVHKFGPELQGLKEKFPGSSFTLYTRRHVISMAGSREMKQKVEDIIREVARTSAPMIQEVNDEAACPICMCEVDESYRLENCGHVFCRLCLLEQYESAMKSRDSFPLRCMHEGCGTLILLCDLRTLLVNEKLEELFRSSLSSFVTSSGGKFRFCPSPDCPSVYQVADPDTPDKPFVCGACSVETCTRCHLEYHQFLSCEKYKNFKEDPDSSLKEWCKGKEQVKECPLCGHTIEKIDGCNHIECRCGSHICWVCLEYYGNSDDCYEHLRSVHKAII